MTLELNIQFEHAVRLLASNLPPSTEFSRKPILFHSIRVGVYLYENGYWPDVVLAGVLHDALEWSNITQQQLAEEFGDDITQLVFANTKDDSIQDSNEKINELIKRCVQHSQNALIVKAADVLDSFKWYTSQNNIGELQHCLKNAEVIFKFKPDYFDDKIFDELNSWQNKRVNVTL